MKQPTGPIACSAQRLSRRTAMTALLGGLVAASTGAAACSLTLTGGQRLSVKDFGARGDGFTDDARAVAATISALPQGGTVEFPPGRYFIGSEISLRGKTSLHFTGHEAIILCGHVRSCFDLSNCEGISFSGLAFDARGDRAPTYTTFADGERQAPIRFLDGQGLEILNCTFDNLYTVFVLFKNSVGLSIQCNEFRSPLQRQDQYLTFVEVTQSGGPLVILRNGFYGAQTTRNDRSPCAVCAAGITGALTILENHAEHCGRNNAGTHRLAVFDIYADATNVTVAHNVALNCREQFMRVSTTVDAGIHDNIVTVAAEADTTYSTMTVESGSFTYVRQPVSRRISIRNNKLIDNAGRQAFAIGLLAYDWGAGNQEIRITDNIIIGHATAIFMAGPFDDVLIRGNQVKNVKAFIAQTLSNGPTMTAQIGIESSAHFDRLVIEHNRVELAEGSPVVPVSLSTNGAKRFRGRVGSFVFRGNVLRGNAARTNVAVSAIFNAATPQGQFLAEDNDIAGYETPFYLRSMALARVVRNRVADLSSLLLTDGTVRAIEMDANVRRGQTPPTLPIEANVSDLASPPSCSCN